MSNRRERIFDVAEELNRQVILDVCTPRPGATLLDLGCGDGAFTARVAERVGAARVLAVELEERSAQKAEARGVEVVRTDLAQRLPFDDGSIDVVHANQVIEHLRGTDHFMSEIRRVLAVDGYAVVSTNNLSSLHNIASLILGLQPPPCHVSDCIVGIGNPANFAEGADGAAMQMHLRIFTGRALSGLAEYHGLAIEAAGTAGFYPLGPRMARVAARVAPVYGAFLVQRYRRAQRTWFDLPELGYPAGPHGPVTQHGPVGPAGPTSRRGPVGPAGPC